MRKTNEDTKCTVASMVIISIPFLFLLVYSFPRGGLYAAFSIFLGWFIIGGLISCGVSNAVEKILRETDKKSETSDWIKAFAISLCVIIAGVVGIIILAYILSIFSDFAEFLKIKYGR